jgi:hypothetical protein
MDMSVNFIKYESREDAPALKVLIAHSPWPFCRKAGQFQPGNVLGLPFSSCFSLYTKGAHRKT